MQQSLAQIDAWLFALALAAAMFAAWRLGWWAGPRTMPDPSDSSTARFVDASLAMLGLLLGFSFAMALSRHDQRRAMVIQDSNSIGDFYTCATLLKEPVRSRLQAVIREYVH